MTSASKSNAGAQMVVFGQRGVGKTSFIERLKKYWHPQSFTFLDLDQEIEKRLGVSVAAIFADGGEAVFRGHEKEIFFALLAENPRLVLTVGGGFPVEVIPEEVHTLWLQRKSDEAGRIFLDRPRLDPEKTDLDEFQERAQIRKQKFTERADEIYLMPEGLSLSNPYEEEMFSPDISLDDRSFLTISRLLSRQSGFLSKLRNSSFEYRDDLLEFDEFLEILKATSPINIILSFRDSTKISQSEQNFFQLANSAARTCQVLIDWPLELGSCSQLKTLKPNIISAHEFLPGENLTSFLQRLEAHSKEGVLLKAAPMIESFADLKTLWDWQQVNTQQRSVLPRSRSGRWVWFRQLMRNRQKINFWKTSDVSPGSAADQPSFYQWLTVSERAASSTLGSTFAAVLGSPVELSWTPVEHQEFFDQYQMPVLAIDLPEDEFEFAIVFLVGLGLKAAAVTSPLKKKAFELLSSNTPGLSVGLTAINTLFFYSAEFQTNSLAPKLAGTNTDLAGFAALVETLEYDPSRVVVWGGGGTLPVIRNVIPEAIECSVRTGLSRDGRVQVSDLSKIDLLIWAAAPNAPYPQLPVNPQYIVDLNYREDSAARSFAKTSNAIYISGAKMFWTQAQKQREFWQPLLVIEKAR